MSSTSTRWNYDLYAAIPEDGLRHEIIRGEHFVNPAPSLYHQTVSRRLQYQLYTSIELTKLGQVFNAPVDLQLSDHDIVQPDLVIVTHARDHILTPAKLVGTPDLVVEILSPTSPGHDRERKRHLYETAEVPEYWIVDAERRSVLQLVLVNGHYTEQECREHFRMAIPPHVNLDLSSVW